MKKQIDLDVVDKLINELDLTNKCRTNEFLFPRCILYFHLKNTHGFSLEKIGKMFNKNHATVLNGIKKYNDLSINLRSNYDFKIVKQRIEAEIFDFIEEPEEIDSVKSLFNRVMQCNNYYSMRLLQEELKKTMQVA